MIIDGKTELYGLIGWPVEHSKSPAMHNLAFEYLGINAVYLCFAVKPNALVSVAEAVRVLGIKGFNVTVPYKEAIIEYLDELTDVAKRIGAVNTVFFRGQKLIGTNTDMEGFIRDLRDTCNFSAKNKNAVVLGAGGAAKAITFGLADAGLKRLFILDINEDRAKRLVKKLGGIYSNLDVSAMTYEDVYNLASEIDLIVNATPVGMKESDPALLDLAIFPKTTLVYDVVYNPPLTTLLKQAKRLNMPYTNGAGMLLQQAALAFKHWTAVDPPLDIMSSALEGFLIKGGRNV